MTCMKTFVYHDGALGDVLLSLACLERLKADSGEIHLAGRGEIVRFLKDAGAVDAAISSDQAMFASLYSAIDPVLQAFLAGYDRAYIFTAQEHTVAAAAFSTAIPNTRTIRTIPPDESQMHVAQYRLSQLEQGARLSSQYGGLHVPPERDISQSFLRKAGYNPTMCLIAVHPGSGGRLKCWPLERYFELIERLQSLNDAFVILFTGDAEADELRKTVCSYARDRKNVLHAADFELIVAASVLSQCALYIGNDSGFSHLAGMVGCTTIALFGPTDPLRWKPLGPRVEVVSLDSVSPMEHITVDAVIKKAEPVISTVPTVTYTDVVRCRQNTTAIHSTQDAGKETKDTGRC